MTQKNKPFTLEQIYEASKKVKSGAEFPQFIQDLQTIGVTHSTVYVSNGRTTYSGANGFELEGEPFYPTLTIKPNSSAAKLKHAITIHQQGQTDYPTFCIQAAEAGVEKWITDALKMTVSYLDKQGKELSVEPIPQPPHQD